MPNGKVLKSRDEIREHYGLSRTAFDKFISMGMPARIIDGKWYAHVDNIDQFFKKITAGQGK